MVKIITSKNKMKKLIDAGNIYESRPHEFKYFSGKVAYKYKPKKK